MTGQALELIYYTFKKTLSFLLSATIGSDGTGSVSLLFIFFAVYLFGILFRFLLSVPRTYRGERDGSATWTDSITVESDIGTTRTLTRTRRYRGGL